MNQFLRMWNSLSLGQRISLIVVPIVGVGMVFGLLRWRRETDFKPLYTSLAPEDASAVVAKIREAGIEYRLDETGSTILVGVSQLAEARLAVAAAGLPHTGRIGFELFDRPNLGASDFAEQVNYRRALEGELERTVNTLSEVALARIHLTFAKESVFLDAREPPKATVVLQLKRNGRIEQSKVTAIANLIASAVEGLSPDAVAIIDSSGRLLNRPHAAEGGEERLAESSLDYRHQVEAELLTKINASLDPLLGAGRFRAGLSVECDFTSMEENDEVYDASKSVIVQSQTSEESNTSALAGGPPGTAANLPQPPARASGGAGGSTRHTENTTFQPGKTIRHTVAPRGTLKKISTAILVDQTVRWDGVGLKARKTLIPPSAQVLKVVHDVVAGVTGYNETRGDQITVETLPFENTLSAEPPSLTGPDSGTQGAPKSNRQLIVGGAAIVLLLAIAAWFLLARRSGLRRAAPAQNTAPVPLAAGAPAAPAQAVETGVFEQQIADNQSAHELLEAEALTRIKLPGHTKKTDALTKHIRDSVQKDPIGAANVLRTWVGDKAPVHTS
ncbi:MAG: flagellar basal-body MS-ring/collar protein FliF [Terriglobia bacterium]